MNDIWLSLGIAKSFVIKEFYIAIILILAAVVNETVLKDE